jgi:hypothetical protein
MTSITATAKEFFDACETGKGWDGCKTYCTAEATFSAKPRRESSAATRKTPCIPAIIPLDAIRYLPSLLGWRVAGKTVVGR